MGARNVTGRALAKRRADMAVQIGDIFQQAQIGDIIQFNISEML